VGAHGTAKMPRSQRLKRRAVTQNNGVFDNQALPVLLRVYCGGQPKKKKICCGGVGVQAEFLKLIHQKAFMVLVGCKSLLGVGGVS
jgi:hypothetical protein